MVLFVQHHKMYYRYFKYHTTIHKHNEVLHKHTEVISHTDASVHVLCAKKLLRLYKGNRCEVKSIHKNKLIKYLSGKSVHLYKLT